MFSFECTAWSNFRFAFKSLLNICLADFAEDNSHLFIETFIIPPTLAMCSFTILRGMIVLSLVEFPCMSSRCLSIDNPFSGTLFPWLILSTHLVNLNNCGYFNWPESFLIVTIFLQYTSMRCWFGTFDGTLTSKALKAFPQ